MSALTPTREHTIYQIAAEMMAAATSDADRARIDRALDLVSGVERMARPDLFLVTSQTVADAAYRVHQGQCNCPDASKRDARRCKHAYAVALFCQLERAEVDAEQDEDDDTRPDVDEDAGDEAFPWERESACPIRVDPEDSILDLWPGDGESCDLPAQCPRCHAEPRTTRHPDGLGLACISAELFGEAN